MTLACAATLSFWDRLLAPSPLSLLIAGAVLAALVVAGIGAIAVAAFRGVSARRLPLLWTAVLFLTVFASKLLLMQQVPVLSPFWDQWDGEAVGLFLPLQQCQLSWARMFDFHNEHRVFFTRLLSLDLLLLNGQWEPRVEQVVNALLHTCIAVTVALTCWRAADRRRLDVIVAAVVLAFAPPFGWENTLLGFQSAFYFQVLFAVLAVWLATESEPGSWPWWLGWTCAAAGVFTAAGGFLVVLPIAAILALKWWSRSSSLRATLAGALATAGVAALGIATMSPPLVHHAQLRAETPGVFATALGRNLAFPWTFASPWIAVLTWLPIALVILKVISRRRETTPLERFSIGLGIWVAVQAAAIAYGRGAGGAPPLSRYLDFFSLGFVANVAAAMALYDGASAPLRKPAIAVLALMLVSGVAGVERLIDTYSFLHLRVWRGYFAAQPGTVRDYVITGDLDRLSKRVPAVEVPYPVPDHLGTILTYPEVRRVLPAAVRQPIDLKPQSITAGAFALNATPLGEPAGLVPVWGSYGSGGRADQGRFESEVMPRCRAGGRLAIDVAGYLGPDHHQLTLIESGTGREHAIRPVEAPGDQWTTMTLACPSAPFSLVATDDDAASWFAFRTPVEVGPLSGPAETLISVAGGLLLGALALAFVAARWTGSSGYPFRGSSPPADAARNG